MEQPQFRWSFFPMEHSTSLKEASTKIIVAKTVIIIIWLPGKRVDHCGLAKSILRLSSSKNEGGCVRLCQNSVAFMLPTTVAPVKCTLVTMVALGSFFSCFNTSLSLNDNIFIRCCCRALLCTCKPGKSDMFSAKVKTKV